RTAGPADPRDSRGPRRRRRPPCRGFPPPARRGSASGPADSWYSPGPPPRSRRVPPSARPRSRSGPDRRALRSVRSDATRGRGPDPASFDERLGDLHGVRRRALAEVVRHDPEGEAPVAVDRWILAHPADEDLVRAGRLRRERIG